MKIYLSGPMSLVEDFNYPAFHAAAVQLRAEGYEVINPAELLDDPGLNWGDFMRRDLRLLLACDEVRVLPGWERSKGASLEVYVAQELGVPVKKYL